MKIYTKLGAGLLTLAILSPLGLWAKGTAWGEWSGAELRRRLGFAPRELMRLESLWSGVLPGYGFRGDTGATHASRGYIFSALLGIVLLLLLGWIIGRAVNRR